MLSVLFITRKWPPAIGGMETYSVELTQELSKLTHLTTLKLAGKTNGKPPSLPKLFLFLLGAASKIIFSKPYDVVHVGDMVQWPLCLLTFLFKPSSKVLITAYGLDIVYSKRKGIKPKIYGIYLWLGKTLLGEKLNVIAISTFTAGLCMEAGFKKVTVVPLGVRIKSDNAFYKNDRLVDSSPYLLFVGRLVSRKGIGWFINNVLPSLDKNIQLIVVGKQWDETEFHIIQNNSRVKYFDYVSDEKLRELRMNSIAVLMPNIPSNGLDVEGFGLTAIEATADGGILLASAIEGIVDAVIDGKTGFLLPSQNTQAWVAKINEIQKWTNEERDNFIHRGLTEIQKNFTWEAVATKTLTCYQTAINEVV